MLMDTPKPAKRHKMNNFVNYFLKVTLFWAAVLFMYPLM